MRVQQFLLNILRLGFYTGLFFILLALFIWSYFNWYLLPQLPPIAQLREIPVKAPLQIYTSEKKLIAEYARQRCLPIKSNDIPPLLIQAFLAAEDSHFYQHSGIRFKSLIRAAFYSLKTGKVQGGSTITMQVARNFYLSPEKRFTRKVKEILLAWHLERKLKKDDILELYLNKIFFGHNAYGIGAAAQVYYGKSYQKLSLAQYAMLAGLPKAPSANNPLTNPKRALVRRNYILKQMHKLGYISQAAYHEALQEPLSAQKQKTKVDLAAPYIAEMVRAYLVKKYGEENAYTAGYKVYATIDSHLQTTAQIVLRHTLLNYNKLHRDTSQQHLAQMPQIQGALVSLNPNTGAIIALVGGFDFSHSQFNRVTQARRQPGSTFKPFIYSAALESGYTPASIIKDAPFILKEGEKIWQPRNNNDKFYGAIRLREALKRSLNSVSIRLMESIGISHTIDYLTRFGFQRSQLPPDLTLSLGTATVTPLEMASAYAVFANGGFLVKPYFIERIEDFHGNLIYQTKPKYISRDSVRHNTSNLDIPTRVISPQNAWLITSMLKDIIPARIRRRALIRHDLAGKTGTTNEYKDVWFTGYNADIVTTTWAGFDQPRSLGKRETPERITLPMWIQFMGIALQNRPFRRLPKPPGLITVRINPQSGLLADNDDPYGIFETFPVEKVPTH
jgi:penicillin-binding protein 1A